MPTTIRPLTPDEIQSLTPHSFTLAPVFDDLARYASPSGALLVGEVDGSLAAAAALFLQCDTLSIDHFVVSPRFRGHGLGGKLLRACVEHAKSKGAARVRSLAPAWCPDWRAFYTRHGFVYTDARTADTLTDMTPVELQIA
jgi:GNAT superfamily N-acetyltransferase